MNVLVGQGVSARLLGAPPGCTWSNYQWTVQGDTVSGFYLSPAAFLTPADAQGYPLLVDPSAWSSAAPHWYWGDNGGCYGYGNSSSVSVTATLRDPSGNSVGTVNVTQPLFVWAPGVSATGWAPQPSTAVENGFGLLTGLDSASESNPGMAGTP